MKKQEDKGFMVFSHLFLSMFALLCLFPLLLLIVSSFTDEMTIVRNGYSLFPEKLSLDAYNYIYQKAAEILRAYSVTIMVTVIGTSASILLTALIAYPLSRKDLPGRRFFTLLVVLTLLFNGGLVPTYLVYTRLLHIKNTIWALIVPMLMVSGFGVMIMKTYFSTSIPGEILESAKIDGAGEFLIFFKIVIPMSLPILATIGLLAGLAYWNDWYNGLIYLTDQNLFSLQNVLNRIMIDIQYLSSTSAGLQASAAELPSETVRMAIAAIAVIPVLCVYPFFQKYFIKGIALGAVKG